MRNPFASGVCNSQQLASSSASLSSFDNSDSSDDAWDEWVANNCDAIQQAERDIHEHQALMEAIRNHTM